MLTPPLSTITQTALSRSLGTLPRSETFPGGVIFYIGDASFRTGEASFHGKVIILGAPFPSMLPGLGIRVDNHLPPLQGLDSCPPAAGDLPFSESPAFLVYPEHALAAGLSPAMRCRAFTRFDYTDEWNNLGYGRIHTDGSIWAAHDCFVPDGALELAGIYTRGVSGEAYCGAYLTLFDTQEASVLWCSRPVGPVDSTEWSLIERFISDWRAEDMPCLPCLGQTPAGCRCLVTMRLDCDEDVGSARNVFAWYAKEGIPFSLAVKTSLELGQNDMSLLADVRAAGGSVLSHTHRHQYNWGPTYEEALADASSSRAWFRETWPQLPPPDIAVSPFHSNAPYAVQALVQAKFTGFVSGIIHNDPEYLLGRAGIVPFADGIVSISQQSMLHGDCYRRQHESVGVHVQAFEAQYAASGIFGYLDHPFSQRYQYDWASEEQRLHAHQQLISALRGYEGVWFWNQERCFDFIRALAQIRLGIDDHGCVCRVDSTPTHDAFSFTYRYHGQEYALPRRTASQEHA